MRVARGLKKKKKRKRRRKIKENSTGAVSEKREGEKKNLIDGHFNYIGRVQLLTERWMERREKKKK